MFHSLLAAHIAFGALGLFLGPIAMYARKRPGLHTRVGGLYHWNMLAVCASAAGLAVLHWRQSAFMLLVAVFSYGLALKGYRAARRRGPGWLSAHVSGMLGSYIALVTALLVVNAGRIPLLSALPPLVAWLLPTAVGSPLIRWIQRRQADLIARPAQRQTPPSAQVWQQ